MAAILKKYCLKHKIYCSNLGRKFLTAKIFVLTVSHCATSLSWHGIQNLTDAKQFVSFVDYHLIVVAWHWD
jgi:hypothetical protein